MTEEQVTTAILQWLRELNWEIISYDFPQAGTGLVLHPQHNMRKGTKNKGSLIPDILAVRQKTAVLFENKDRFFKQDFEKINRFRTTNDYTEALDRILSNYNTSQVYYGVGGPNNDGFISRAKSNESMVDFIVAVSVNMNVTVAKAPQGLF